MSISPRRSITAQTAWTDPDWGSQYKSNWTRSYIYCQGPCGNTGSWGYGINGQSLPTKVGSLVPLDMEHGLAAPGGGVQARLNPGYQTLDILERHGQGPPPQLWPLHGPGMPT